MSLLDEVKEKQNNLEESLGLEIEQDIFYTIEENKYEQDKFLLDEYAKEVATELSNELNINELFQLFNDYKLDEWIEEAKVNGFYQNVKSSEVQKILSRALYVYLSYIFDRYIKKYI